jgi:hypothetical protein
MTATIGIDLGKLSLTDAEKRELDSALKLLEDPIVKQESVLEKYSGLIL